MRLISQEYLPDYTVLFLQKKFRHLVRWKLLPYYLKLIQPIKMSSLPCTVLPF